MEVNQPLPRGDAEKEFVPWESREENAGSAAQGGEMDEPRKHLHTKTFLAVAAMCLIYFAQLVSLVGAGAQGHTIASHFDRASDAVWFTAPITIFTVVLGPIVSQASDYFGRKWFLVVLTSAGGVGSVIIARATSMNMVIAGFGVTGLSFGVQPLLHTVTSEVLPRRWRGFAQATDMLSVGLGSVCGLLVGGALNRTNDIASDGFRYYFYMAMAWYAIAAAICAYAYNPPKTKQEIEFQGQLMAKLARLDWIGYILLASGLVLFSVGLSWANNPYPWSDARVIATLVVGLVLAFALLAYESLFKKDGMFHHDLFRKDRNFPLSLFCIFAEGSAFFAANTYFAFQIGTLYESDALAVGLRFGVAFICAMFSGFLAGWYCAITRQTRWITVLAFVLFSVFFICMATTSRDTNTPTWGYAVILGFGLGTTLTTLITIAQLSTPPELISTASGLFISIRSLGGTIALAIYQTLSINQINNLQGNIASAGISAGLAQAEVTDFVTAILQKNTTTLEAIPGITQNIVEAGYAAYGDTFVTGFRYVWITAECFVLVAGIGAVFLKDTQNEFNMHIDAPVEEE
ncbi:MFS general substrate transporter [Thozetella sp. PMI_491]|nr:MFS general substrate transporter [Thozetella sp. PMI_491]